MISNIPEVERRVQQWLDSNPGADPLVEDEFETGIDEEVDRFLYIEAGVSRAAARNALASKRQRVCSHQGRTTTESAMDGEREYQVLVCMQCDAELDREED